MRRPLLFPGVSTLPSAETGTLPPARGGMPERGEAPKYFQVKNKISAVLDTLLASPRESTLIGTSPALPMLLINRVSRDPQGRALECVRSLYRGDRFSFTTHLTHEEPA